MNETRTLFDKIKEAGSHTIIYGMGSVLQTAVGFILIPVYTRYYTTGMYGTLALINLVGSLAANFFFLGASSALARSYYDYEDNYERKKVVSTSLYISLFGAFLQVVLGVLLSGTISQLLFHNSKYTYHIIIILITTSFIFVNNLFFIVLRFERKSKQVITLDIISLFMSSLLIFFLLVSARLGIMAPILGGLISQVVIFIILFYLVRNFIVLDYSRHELKVQLPFGLQSVFAGLAYFSFDWLNRIFINKYGSLGDVGIYTLGYQIGMTINILFILPFSQIWAPMRMEYRNDHNIDEFYGKILTYYTVIGLIVTVLISLFSKELITLVGGNKEYIAAYKVVPFVMLGLLIYGTVGLIDHGIYFARKMKYHAYIFWFVAMISLLLNIIFVRLYGYMAAAVIIFICYLSVASLVFYVSNKLYKIPYEGKRLALNGSIGFISLVLGYLAPFNTIYSGIMFKSAIAVLMLILIGKFVLTSVERGKILYLLGRFIKWKKLDAKV